ncbi:MAG: tetratricopeptide repeat protein, partial [Pseudoalteromonas sp.]|uniref:tetratricopeptide repeat protein n=1 Tax=Pseudoalteromonas sp. TaxID=53249 RepID=UPI0025DCD8CF
MRFFLLFLFFWSLSSAAFAENIPSTRPINEAAVIDKAKNSNDLVYQQIFSMQSQLARLDEGLEVQKSLGNDVKLLENTQQELKIQLASLQTKLETQEKLQTNQLNGFNGRISDIASSTNMWGMAFTIFGLIITVAAIALGFSAKNRAVYEAKQAANTASESHMEKWLLDNKDKLIADTKTELKNVSLQLKERAEKLEVEARDALEKIKQEQQLAWDALLEENKDVVTSKRNKEDNTTTKHNKPKVYQTAQEWFKAGLKAFSSNEYDEALNAWNKVLGLVDSEQESKLYAITMVNQGVTYGRLGKADEELNSYATLIERFKDSSNEEIQIPVANAMCNQSVAYRQQGKLEYAISSYSTLIEQFKDSSNEEIQTQVATAVFNQGVAYGQQGKPDEELNSYATLIEQFKDSSNEEIQIQVAQAVYNQGVTYGQQGKLEDAISSYATLIEQFKDSSNEMIQIQVAKAVYNQGVTYGEQGKPDDELNSYATLIEQFKDSSNEEIQIQVAQAVYNQGVTYG